MMTPPSTSPCRGLALIDALVACCVLAILATLAIPRLHASRERDATILAARHLASKLHAARIDSLRRNRAVAFRFDPDDVGRYSVIADGDGDGVLQQDVDNGTDNTVELGAHIADHFPAVVLGIAQDVLAPDGNTVMAAGSDPVRIGGSNFLSFSPQGTATSGTIYLAGYAGTQVCVRVLGATGRIRVLRFDRGSATWRQD